MKLLLFIFLWSLPALHTRSQPRVYDICIYGATSAGVMAAYAAVKKGSTIVLIEPRTHIGGLTAGGLGFTDIGNKYAISGLALDFYRRMGKHYGQFESWIFEPHVADSLFKDYLRRGNINVLTNHQLLSASMQGNKIREITVKQISGKTTKLKTFVARMFIDCTYEGDLMAKAGVSYTTGRESNKMYEETYNGVQLMSGHQFPHGIDPYVIPGDTSSGLLWGVSRDKLEKTGTGDKKIQAYNFRICLTNNDENKISVSRPADYDSTKYELLLRLFEAQPDRRKLNDYFIVSPLPNNKTDINNRGGFSTDLIGLNYKYPEATWEEREEIIKQHESYTKGLLYFYATDRRVPEQLRNEMMKWGYPRDEYSGNGHWSPQLYIRESRRMIGEYVMSQADCELKTTVNDGIGMAAYTMDSHNCQRLVVGGMVKNEGNVEVGGGLPYPVPFRAIVPKKEECQNLLVPVCLSATHIAYGSIRMEPVFMVLAQSAAIAAANAIDQNKAIQDIDIKKVQEELRENPLLDGSEPDIIIDNTMDGVRLEGEWQVMKKGGFGPSYLVSDTIANASRYAEFSGSLERSGKFDVYSYYIPLRNISPVSFFDVNDGIKNHKVVVYSKDIVVRGQTSGEWVKLGTYAIEKGRKFSVKIYNRERKGTVIADAVLLVPVKEDGKKN